MAQKDPNVGSDLTKCSIVTETKMHEIRSTVENVSKLPNGIKVTGPDFYIAPDCMCCVSFKKNENHLYVYIRNKSATDIKIERTLVLYDCNNKKLHEERAATIFSLEKDRDQDVIGNVPKLSSYDTLTKDTLIIDLCVNIKEIIGKRYPICNIDHVKKLREDLKKMLENPVNSDVSLQVGDERIPAHWSILCSRSPYFKKMFDSNMKERVENSITITDLSLHTLKNLVEFLYTAHFVDKDDLQELFDLYYAADRYEVMDLRALCGHNIISKATADNVCQILQFLHRHNDEFLVKAIGFIQLHSDAVFQTDGWKKFKASEPLATELFRFFCVKIN